MRILGVDYGKARTGIAVSDPLGLMAHGIETIFSSNMRTVASRAAELAKEYEAGIIVVGLPKNMNNTLGERAEKTLRFVKLLEAESDAGVVTWDERLSTVSAINILNETNTRGEKRKAVVDTVAAQIILQGYLDHIRKE